MRSDDGLETSLKLWETALVAGEFEEVFDSLEEIVRRLEDGGLTLASSLRCYELGAQLAKRCAKMLDEAELRISRLEIELDPPSQATFDEQ